MKKILNTNLKTPEYELLNRECPLSEYPRPSFKRDSYISLNGEWDYLVTDKFELSLDFEGKILVPYCIESLNSGVQRPLKKGEWIIYHRKFNVPKEFIKDKTILHFMGIEQVFDVMVNGVRYENYVSIGLPKKIDISDSIKEENEIYIRVKDDLDLKLPYGKQVINQHGMWYTSVSGIYYPVYIESVNEGYIESVKIDTTMDSVKFKVTSKDDNINVLIKFKDEVVYEGKLINDEYIKLDNIHLWDEDNPNLYDVVLSNEYDKVETYFALRKVELIDGLIYLNNKRIFLNGVLDQGYYPEGIYTVSDYKSYERDILMLKDLGINCIRKHIKVEMDYFYYLCDKLGMIVLQDFVNNGKYSFLIDTALPTVLPKLKINDKNRHTNKIQRENFIKHGEGVIKYLHNHPCVIGYTIFNEGWGQFNADKVYEHFKKLEPNYLFDATSGWFHQTKSDFDSLHIYFRNINPRINNINHPVFISEFGGYSYKLNDHSFNLTNTYGYKTIESKEDYENALIDLYENQILANKDKLVGCIFTQVSDVEDETNGFVTYDRKVVKVDSPRFKELMRKIKE